MYESLGTIFIQTTTEKGDVFTELMNVILSVEFCSLTWKEENQR